MEFEREQQFVLELKQYVTDNLSLSKMTDQDLEEKIEELVISRLGNQYCSIGQIGDNTAVSRSHANFITRDGEYFVVDTNSTNHTFVNGQMTQSNSEVKISPGDTIRLGNEDFEFKIY